jgi:type III secretion system FlhB-like substrate exporter
MSQHEQEEAPARVIGLQYDPEKGGLPQIVVKGAGYMADEILKRRDWLREQPVVRDPQLIEQLFKLPVDARIGPELFQLVATLLVHVFAIEGKLRRTQK